MRKTIFYDHLGDIPVGDLEKLIGLRPETILIWKLLKEQVPSGKLRVGAEFEFAVRETDDEKAAFVAGEKDQPKKFLRLVVESINP